VIFTEAPNLVAVFFEFLDSVDILANPHSGGVKNLRIQVGKWHPTNL
jgi:hypothetical protein